LGQQELREYDRNLQYLDASRSIELQPVLNLTMNDSNNQQAVKAKIALATVFHKHSLQPKDYGHTLMG
jgi:hypothetical protein